MQTPEAEARDSRLIALTGGTGFVGGNIRRQLEETGIRHRLLARDPARLEIPGEVVAGSLGDESALQRLCSGATDLIHCAGSVRGATKSQFDEVNVHGAAACAHAASRAGVRRFVLISSLAAREPDLSNYAASKRRGEKAVLEAAGNMKVVIVRPPAVYGPGDRELLPLLRAMARGRCPIIGEAGRSRFSMIFVDDLARAAIALLDSDCASGSVLEIDDGKNGGYGWSEFRGIVSSITNRPVKPFRIPRFVIGIAAILNYAAGAVLSRSPMLTPGKVRELTHPDWVCHRPEDSLLGGWRPRIGLAEGLRNTPGWLK